MIRNVDGIATVCRDVGCPCGVALALVGLYGCHLAIGAALKGIFAVQIHFLVPNETLSVSRFPFVVSVLFSIMSRGQMSIGVHDNLMWVRVAFAGHQHVRTSVLQHRHNVLQDITRGILVLHGLHNTRTLPFPARIPQFVVQSMTAPQRNMPSLQSLLGDVRARKVGCQCGRSLCPNCQVTLENQKEKEEYTFQEVKNNGGIGNSWTKLRVFSYTT